jgi:hypothetical protein
MSSEQGGAIDISCVNTIEARGGTPLLSDDDMPNSFCYKTNTGNWGGLDDVTNWGCQCPPVPEIKTCEECIIDYSSEAEIFGVFGEQNKKTQNSTFVFLALLNFCVFLIGFSDRRASRRRRHLEELSMLRGLAI